MGVAVQKVETAETLLEKRDVLAREMEVVSSELKAEEARTNEKAHSEAPTESIDPLDAFMSSVSSKIGTSLLSYILTKIENLLLLLSPKPNI